MLQMSSQAVLKSLGGAAVVAVLCVLPFVIGLYRLDVIIFLLINIIVAVSYRFITLTGEWSLGHVVMMGVGGYASALLAKKLGLSVWLAMPLGGLATAALTFLLAFPLFRMKGFYFLIGSFAAGEAIRRTWNLFRDPFGGPGGLARIPTPELELPGVGLIDFGDPRIYYFLTLAVVLVSIVVFYRLEKSRIGLTLHAIHWQDSLAESVGVNIWRYKTLAFCVASFFVGIAGALLGHHITVVNPPQFSLTIMLYVLVWVIVGGTRTIAGPIVGVTVLSIVDESLRELLEYRPLIYGVILILTMRFLPAGLESLPAKLMDLREMFRRIRTTQTGS